MPNVTGRRAQGHPGPIGPDDRDHLPYLTVRGRIQPERVDVSAGKRVGAMAIKVAGPAQETGGPGLSRVIGPGGAAWWLSAALGVAAAASSLLTFTGYLAGLLLIAWIAVELLILRRYFFLQPVIAGIGAAEILLAWRWHRSGRG